MRHRKSGRKFSRTSAHRKAMFRNMTASLVEHELIKTTLPKAKELRRVAEPLITLSKNDSVANRRLAFSRLRDDAAVAKLFDELGPPLQRASGWIPSYPEVWLPCRRQCPYGICRAGRSSAGYRSGRGGRRRGLISSASANHEKNRVP